MVRTYDPNGLRINSRSAEQIAAGQNLQHQQALQENQAAGQVVQRQTAPGLTPQLQAAQQNVQLSAQQPRSGVIEQSAKARIAEAGLTGDEAQKQFDMSKNAAQSTMSNTGQGGTFNHKTGMFNPGSGRADQPSELDKRLGAIDEKYKQMTLGGVTTDPVAIANEKKAATDLLASEQAAQQAERTNQKDKMKGDAAASAAASAATQKTPSSPQDAGVQAAMAQLPPGFEWMGTLLQSQMDDLKKAQQENQQFAKTMLQGGTMTVDGKEVKVKGVESAYDDMDAKLKAMEANQTKAQEGISKMLDKALETQQDYIGKQQKAAEDRLVWEENKARRRIEDEKRKAVESKIAEMAVKGRLSGSDSALAEVDEAKHFYENQLSDLESEVGVQKTELSAKFTGLYTQALTEHTNASIGNIKDTIGALERIGFQSIASTQARQSAEQNVLQNMMNNQTSLRKEHATALRDIGTQIGNVINQKRDDDRAQEQLGWQRLEWAATTYGSGAPQALLDSIGKQLPGVDVRSVASQMTLAEMKKKGAGGSSLFSFSATERDALGKPPSFEDFLVMKEKEAATSGAAMFDTSKDAMAKYRKEYDGKMAAYKRLDPTQLEKEYAVRRARPGIAKNQRDAMDEAFNTAMRSGDYEMARQVLDGTGKQLSAAQLKVYTAGTTTRDNLNNLTNLMYAVREKYGPIQGPFWQFVNARIQSDPDLAAVNALRNQMLGPFARGIMQEVGPLSETDVALAQQALGDMNMSYESALRGMEQTVKNVQLSLQNTIAIERAAGYMVAETAALVESHMTDLSASSPVAATAGPQLSTEQEAWLNSY